MPAQDDIIKLKNRYAVLRQTYSDIVNDCPECHSIFIYSRELIENLDWLAKLHSTAETLEMLCDILEKNNNLVIATRNVVKACQQTSINQDKPAYEDANIAWQAANLEFIHLIEQPNMSTCFVKPEDDSPEKKQKRKIGRLLTRTGAAMAVICLASAVTIIAVTSLPLSLLIIPIGLITIGLFSAMMSSAGLAMQNDHRPHDRQEKKILTKSMKSLSANLFSLSTAKINKCKAANKEGVQPSLSH